MPRLNVNTARGALGKRGEDLAAAHMEEKGYTMLERNFECKLGEIDIVAVDQNADILVFAEVKTRRSLSYGNPSLAVISKKKMHIRNSAMIYLLGNEENLRNKGLINTETEYRFDVISVLFEQGKREIEHIEGAFQ